MESSWNRRKPQRPKRSYPRRQGRVRRILLAVLVCAIAVGGAALIWKPSPGGTQAGARVGKTAVLALWKESRWTDIIAACDSVLGASPLDPFYLSMKGLASFYAAMELPDDEERSALVLSSIAQLRKTLALHGPSDPRIPRRDLEYVLGKAYFHSDPAFRDLAAKYLEAAVADGQADGEVHVYLAMSYSGTGESEKAIAEYEKAMALEDGAMLKLAAAREYLASGQTARGEGLLLAAVASTNDAIAREKARILLVQSYFGLQRIADAESQVQSILADNPESADGHYWLGAIFQAKGDPVHARAEWRLAVSIDPMHAAARQKLAERF